MDFYGHFWLTRANFGQFQSFFGRSKFENRNSNTDGSEKPSIKLEPEDGEIKDSKIEKTYDEPQERFQFSKYHHFYIMGERTGRTHPGLGAFFFVLVLF